MAEGSEVSAFSQRRVRHITAIQVRNLTAFPVRDAFASALSQPSEQSQFTAPGYLSDDLDVTLSKKRGRRISTNSVGTFKSLKSDDSLGDEDTHSLTDSRGTKRRSLRLSFGGGGSPATRQAPTIRGHRPRTTSLSSSLNSSIQSSAALPSTSTVISSVVPFASNLPDHSQTGLEKVIKSRLFETFIAVSVEPSSDLAVAGPSSPSTSAAPPSPVPSNPPTSPRSPKAPNGVVPRKGVKPSPLSPSMDKATANGRRDTPISPTSPSTKHTPKSASISVLRPNGKAATPSSPSSRKSPPPQTPPSTPRIRSATPPPPPPRSASPSSAAPLLPDYISPVHRPSTNPLFTMDVQSGFWSNPSGQRLNIELWGKGKQKEESGRDGSEDEGWRVLEEWNLDMGQLLPLQDDTQLPFNALVVTLHPPGRTFYLPPASTKSDRRSPSPSVEAGYASDPESGVKTVKKVVGEGSTVQFSTTAENGAGGVDVVALSRRRHRRGAGAGDAERDRVRTAGWQDLFKLAMLQSSIQDNQVSLNDVVREIDKVLEGDTTSALRREVSERESLVQALRKNVAAVYDQSEILKEKIELRRQQLQERREMLALAQELRDEDVDSEDATEEQVSTARTELITLQSRFTPTRTTLISTLSTIFPIELLSPPDLLYTILDVPLPIPLTASDPAPPLFLPAHKDVTDEAVATALGYVAQVVQLLAAYLGKGLVYPITCIGSRSMIRDGISAMVGPRMFPLFSKGVDTYRFEYGVFLLNKDIELLMADRDLRALDMRHTLPNLKNLLLTLTDGEGVQLRYVISPLRLVCTEFFSGSHNDVKTTFDCRGPRVPNSPEQGLTGLESPRAESPVTETGSSTPKAQHNEELPAEGNTPPASGSTTPTTTDTAKKGRSFIGLSPIAGFLRARYPSAIRATPTPPVAKTNDVAPAAEVAVNVNEELEDEEDRRTIRGDVVAGDVGMTEEAAETTLNGAERGSEKLGEVPVHATAPAHPPPPVTQPVK
ncbi:hypothetical protein R3P38DRAFT_2492219 [Favolaschia claudopus]|uniref:Autophagy-related protein 14 n=1 Tax=Favolaschia claudopus TaxID=2862362 RepID=A0AAW0EIW8_9AGAR